MKLALRFHRVVVSVGVAFSVEMALDTEAAALLPTSAVASNYFFTVHSNASSAIWIAPPTWRVMRDTASPSARGQGIDLYAARNEYEPVQVVVRSTAAGTRSLNLGATWSGPSGNIITATLHDVAYGMTACATGDPDRLNPVAFGDPLTVCVNSNQVFWLTVFVPTNAAPGIYSNTITCALPSVTTNFPIRVHVFNFALPAETAFGSFVNWSFSGTPATDLEMKRWFHQHRLTPRQVTYPSGMTPTITWDSAANTNRCLSFFDEPTEAPIYSIRWLAHQFVAGVGFNDGAGFPNFLTHQFTSNIQPRPSTFCGNSITGDPRGTHYGTAAYNAAWGNYLSALQNYCDPTVSSNSGGNPFGHDYLSKAVYFVMNEPQNAADYDLAAWLAQVSRQYAPKLRLMISEEAKPEIYNNALYPNQGYNIWLAHLPAYSTAIGNSMNRKRDYQEQTWWYSLLTDPRHFISPNQTNRPAIETRILCWLAWQHRVEGWSDSGTDPALATFLGGTSFAPTIRSELLRESFEDYEYFKLANGGQNPGPFQPNIADKFVSLIASTLTGFDRDPSKLHWLRVQLGRQISGEGAALPLLPLSAPRPYGSYNIDFGWPTGSSPFSFNGRTWIAMGWQLYDPATNNSGWYVADTNTLVVKDTSLGNTLERRLLYDDFTRLNTFVFGLANGIYDVELVMGWPAPPVRVSQMLVTLNGVNFFGNRLANSPQSVTNLVSVTNRITVANETLVMEVGQHVNGDYNFINYMTLNAVSPSSPDGLDDLWQTTVFGSATNILAAPEADPDGDGAENFLEFHFGTSPNLGTSRPIVSAVLPAPNQVRLQWTSASNHVFRVEQTSDLSGWASALDQVQATNSTTTVTLVRPVNSPQGFYRVVPIAP
jgi:hypothetical protein